jgi:hypothetical protein
VQPQEWKEVLMQVLMQVQPWEWKEVLRHWGGSLFWDGGKVVITVLLCRAVWVVKNVTRCQNEITDN